MSEFIVFGIPNCDKVRAARKWLKEKGIAYQFFDLRKDGLTIAQVRHWCTYMPITALINTRSTTWRQLDEAARTALLSKEDLDSIVAHPTVLKRPILQTDSLCLAGFDAAKWQEVLNA